MPHARFYTRDYLGEMVSANTSWKTRNDPDSMTWVERTIFNEEHNSVAHVIGNSTSRKDFNLPLLKGQHGGEGGVQSVGQTYGCNLLYKDFAPDFLICTNKIICKELVDSGYCEDNIVYSNVKNILQHPGHFHLYPKLFTASIGNLALRLACADGHKTVFMLGMTTYNTETDNIYYEQHEVYKTVNQSGANNKLVNDSCKIFLTYPDVKFYYVCKDPGLMPEEYNWCPNVEEITVLQYYNLAQLGAIAH